MPATSAIRTASPLIAVVVFSAMLSWAHAQNPARTPDSDNGRYTFEPSVNGVLRLDTRNGAISECYAKRAGWACYAAPDERAAFDAEIGRLQNEIQKLKSELAKRDVAEPGSKTDAPLGKQDSEKRGVARERGNRLELQLPDERDIDRAVTFLERAWKRLIEMATRVQKDLSGKI